MTYVGKRNPNRFALVFYFSSIYGYFFKSQNLFFHICHMDTQNPYIMNEWQVFDRSRSYKKLQNYLTGQLLSQLMKITLHVNIYCLSLMCFDDIAT